MSGGVEPIDDVVPELLEGERVDRVVAMLADVSRRRASELIDDGHVLVNGDRPEKPSVRLATGDRIEIRGLREVPAIGADPSVDVPVIHVDESVIVVDKPAGLVVHPGAGVERGTLVQGLLARYPDLAGVGPDSDRPGIVHRLDKGTSGLLVVARGSAAFASLSRQLAERSVDRRYRALVWGSVESAEGVIDAPIGRSHRDPTRQAVVADGREARTRYRVQARYLEPSMTELWCRLETGRTHQIRVHLDAIGHPIVGDDRYGTDGPQALDRPFLHAAELGFAHPDTGERVFFESPLPPELSRFLDELVPSGPGE